MPIDIAPSPETSTARTLEDAFVGFVNSAKAAYDNGQLLLWNNPWGLTPPQVVAVMGTRAALYVSQAQALGEFVNNAGLLNAGTPIQCVSQMPVGAAFTFSPDGSATLTMES